LGFRIKASTGDVVFFASATAGLVFAALGLRTSRLLRFCDLAMSVSPCLLFKAGAPREFVGIAALGQGYQPRSGIKRSTNAAPSRAALSDFN
jgi:hypothetical protein